MAASEGDAAAVASCLDGGAAVDARDGEGCTALHWAADRGHLEARSLHQTPVPVPARSALTPEPFSDACCRWWSSCWPGGQMETL